VIGEATQALRVLGWVTFTEAETFLIPEAVSWPLEGMKPVVEVLNPSATPGSGSPAAG
jgi:hypothetical protein